MIEDLIYVINNHPDKNYLEQLINFCNHINIMIYSNEEIYGYVILFYFKITFT